MLEATIVTTQKELEQINQLNQQNLKQNVTPEERANEGFVSWLYPVQLLEAMHKLAPSVIVKDGDLVVGYALVTPKESVTFHPDLQGFLNNMQPLTFKQKNLLDYNFYCMGQICIHRDYRGQGVFAMLYKKHRDLYSSKYELLVTEVSAANPRSMRAHEKVGFETIYTHVDEKDTWYVIAWDWK